MFSGKFGKRALTSWIAGAILAVAVPALAQTGRVQGKVVDEKGAGIGALAGAAVGALTGDNSKERRKRALIGAGSPPSRPISAFSEK